MLGVRRIEVGAWDLISTNHRTVHERTITFGDGSTLFVEESVVGVITHGTSTGFLEITQTITGARAASRGRRAAVPASSISTRVP